MIIPERHKWARWMLGFLAICLMTLVYIFQRKWLWFPEIPFTDQVKYLPFIMNRLSRLIINDSLCLLLFIAIFNRKAELKLASWVFVIELMLVLPFYLTLKLLLEGDAEISTPLLSFIHRLIVNPLLMMILLSGLLYQRFRVER